MATADRQTGVRSEIGVWCRARAAGVLSLVGAWQFPCSCLERNHTGLLVLITVNITQDLTEARHLTHWQCFNGSLLSSRSRPRSLWGIPTSEKDGTVLRCLRPLGHAVVTHHAGHAQSVVGKSDGAAQVLGAAVSL